MATSTSSVSRVRRWARITAAIEAFQASNRIDGASACRKGRASSITSAGVCSSASSCGAPPSAVNAPTAPIQLLAPSAASATRCAADGCPAPRLCVITTPMPEPTMRNSRNSVTEIWLAIANAAPATSDICAASEVPATPTATVSTSSTSSGQASVKIWGRGAAIYIRRAARRRPAVRPSSPAAAAASCGTRRADGRRRPTHAAAASGLRRSASAKAAHARSG
jgi:hypothetical protein